MRKSKKTTQSKKMPEPFVIQLLQDYEKKGKAWVCKTGRNYKIAPNCAFLNANHDYEMSALFDENTKLTKFYKKFVITEPGYYLAGQSYEIKQNPVKLNIRQIDGKLIDKNELKRKQKEIEKQKIMEEKKALEEKEKQSPFYETRKIVNQMIDNFSSFLEGKRKFGMRLIYFCRLVNDKLIEILEEELKTGDIIIRFCTTNNLNYFYIDKIIE